MSDDKQKDNRIFTSFLDKEDDKSSIKQKEFSEVAQKFINPKVDKALTNQKADSEVAQKFINSKVDDSQLEQEETQLDNTSRIYDVEYDALGLVVLNYHPCVLKAPYRISQVAGDRINYMQAIQGKTPADE